MLSEDFEVVDDEQAQELKAESNKVGESKSDVSSEITKTESSESFPFEKVVGTDGLEAKINPIVPQPVHTSSKKHGSSSKKTIVKIADPTDCVENAPPQSLLSRTTDVISHAIESSEKVGLAVASAAESIVPPGGIDSKSEQSTSELAASASRSTAALATKVVEEGIESATRAVDRSLDAALPYVHSAEDLSAQYVIPLGDRIASSKTVAAVIDTATNTIEKGFQSAQGPVSRIEGLVVQYMAGPLDKRLGQFSKWADEQTPETLASGVSSWARSTAARGGSALQGLKSRWSWKGSSSQKPSEVVEVAPICADNASDGAEVNQEPIKGEPVPTAPPLPDDVSAVAAELAAKLLAPEELPALDDPANQL